MGAVLTAAINRMVGITLTEPGLFNRVLQLEQELTTGGGWQDQIGGAVGGVKLISTEAALVPDPRIHFVRADLVSPQLNGGQTLLYYTGIRRLAKDILRGVVGKYLDRDRFTMSTLRDLHSLPPSGARPEGVLPKSKLESQEMNLSMKYLVVSDSMGRQAAAERSGLQLQSRRELEVHSLVFSPGFAGLGRALSLTRLSQN
jgi:galactokinase/mevalonate kinase-like predicted kinase